MSGRQRQPPGPDVASSGRVLFGKHLQAGPIGRMSMAASRPDTATTWR